MRPTKPEIGDLYRTRHGRIVLIVDVFKLFGRDRFQFVCIRSLSLNGDKVSSGTFADEAGEKYFAGAERISNSPITFRPCPHGTPRCTEHITLEIGDVAKAIRIVNQPNLRIAN